MAKMFTKGFKPKSTTKEARQLIRDELLRAFTKINYDYDGADKLTKMRDRRASFQRMKDKADSLNAGGRCPQPSDYDKGKYLVDSLCFDFLWDPVDQADFLGKIYGRKNVSNWDVYKRHSTYSHLIGREYAKMIEEKKRRKIKYSQKRSENSGKK